MSHVSVFCFLASYLIAFGLELTRLLKRSTLNRLVMTAFGIAGLIAHTWFLVNRSRETHLPPLLSSTSDWMLVLAWLLVVLYLFVVLMHREIALGAFALPVVLVMIGATYFMNTDPNPMLSAQRGWKMLHATGLVFGMLAVTIGFLSSVMYVVQHHRLKAKHGGHVGWEMPSLERLATLNRWSVLISFPLLTLGLGTGVGLGLYSRKLEEAVSFTDPLVLTSGVLWVLVASVFIWLLRHRRPAGKQVAWLTLSAFGFLLITLIALQIMTGTRMFQMESWHG